ncbi:MAG TPA: hypothetical protein EYP81_02640 [Thermodesulfobacteriaceae bacterium]|nr:hypothetical protein [Thermodesulfobacteriaceae bacterium]
MELALKWSYSSEAEEIPIGIFYQTEKPVYEDAVIVPEKKVDLGEHFRHYHL